MGPLLASEIISLPRLALSLIPVLVVLLILGIWQIGVRTSMWAIGRMLVQLMLVGSVLHYIFGAKQAWVVVTTLAIMLGAAGWISLRVAVGRRRSLLWQAVAAIGVGGGVTLAIVTQGVLQLSPWYLPEKMIPLAGMIFSNAMNAISLALDRCRAELLQDNSFSEARRIAFQASLIPITNSLFAVGLVSIPGMMTGQVLADVPPDIAARYQIMVMCMMFGSAGMSTSLFLSLAGEDGLRGNVVQ